LDVCLSTRNILHKPGIHQDDLKAILQNFWY